MEKCESTRLIFRVLQFQGQSRGNSHLPLPAGDPSFDAAQDAVGLLGFKCTCMSSFLSTGTPKSFPTAMLSMSSFPGLYTILSVLMNFIMPKDKYMKTFTTNFSSITMEFMNQHPFIIKLYKTCSFYYCANRNRHTIGQSNKKKLFCSTQ